MKLVFIISAVFINYCAWSQDLSQTNKLLNNIERAYKRIKIYEDEGRIKTFYSYKDQEFVEEKLYKIIHDQRGNFSFTFTDSYADEEKPYYISFKKSDHEETGLYKAQIMDQEGEVNQKLASFIKGMSGISKRIINLSTSLVHQSNSERIHFKNEIRLFDKANLLEDRIIKGESCYVLELLSSKNWNSEEYSKQRDYNSEMTLKNEKQLQSLTKKSDTIIKYFVRKTDHIIIGQERETFFDNGNYVFTRYFMNPLVAF